MTDKTAEERIAERKAAEENLRRQLAEVDLDGPYKITQSGGMFGGFDMFAAGDILYAICFKCGSMVRLNDPEETEPDKVPIERSVRLHTEWHAELEGK